MKQTDKNRIKPEMKGTARAANVLELAALAVILLAAVALSVTSLLTTNYIDPLHYTSQHIVAKTDSLWFNLVVTIGAIALLRVLRMVRIPGKFLKISAAALLSILAVVGIAWILLTKSIPTSDQGHLYNSAKALISGQTQDMTSTDGTLYFYYLRSPYQFGILAYVELLTRVFGENAVLIAAPVINVLFLIGAYISLLRTTDRLFHDNCVTLLTLFMMCVLIQPVLACTVIYGWIPSMAMMVWVMGFTVRYLQEDKKRYLIWMALLSAIAVTIKPNALITVIAVALVLLLHALKSKCWFPLIAALVVLCAAFPGQRIAQASYEARLDTDYGDGQDYVVWISMSMRDSWMACGWYNAYMFDLRDEYGLDIEAYNDQAREDIAERLQYFIDNPEEAWQFYQDKFSSQWNESTFESVWVSAICDSYGVRSKLATSMYDGGWTGEMFDKAMNYAVQLMYAGFLLYVLVLFKKRKTEQLLLPIAIMGGILFHLICEASSKYVLSYLPLFFPLAAYGILTFGLNISWFTRPATARENEKERRKHRIVK